MKKLLAFLFVSFFVSINGWAQDLNFSKTQKFNVKQDMFSIGGWVQDNLLIFYTDRKESFIDIYDATMNKKAIVSLNFMPKELDEVKLLSQGNEAILTYSAQLNSKEVFYMARLDKDAKIIGKPVLLEEASQNFFGNTKYDFNFIHSEDNKTVGVFAFRIKDSKLECQVTLADDSLKVFNNVSLKLPTKSFYGVSQVLLKNDGRLIILATDLSTNKNNEIAEAIVYVITPQDKRSSLAVAHQFDFGNVFTSNIYLKEDYNEANIIHFAGLTKNKKGQTAGIYSGKVDLTAPNNEPILGKSSDFISLNNEDDFYKKNQNNNYVIQDMVVKNDGGLVLVTEAYSALRKYNYSGPGYGGWGMSTMSTNTYTEYTYGDILLLDVDAAQKLNWFSSIPKWQRTIDDYGMYSSFTLLNTGAYLAFVFSEIQNKSIRVRAAISNLNTDPSITEINSSASKGAKWLCKMGEQTGAKQLVIPVLQTNKLQFVMLNF